MNFGLYPMHVLTDARTKFFSSFVIPGRENIVRDVLHCRLLRYYILYYGSAVQQCNRTRAVFLISNNALLVGLCEEGIYDLI